MNLYPQEFPRQNPKKSPPWGKNVTKTEWVGDGFWVGSSFLEAPEAPEASEADRIAYRRQSSIN
jgi:hypothetical protein